MEHLSLILGLPRYLYSRWVWGASGPSDSNQTVEKIRLGRSKRKTKMFYRRLGMRSRPNGDDCPGQVRGSFRTREGSENCAERGLTKGHGGKGV